MRLTTSSGYVSGCITNYAYASTPYKVSTFSTYQYAAQTSGPVFSAPSAAAYEFYLGNRHISSTRFGRISLYADDIMPVGKFDLGSTPGAGTWSSINIAAGASGSTTVTHSWGTTSIGVIMCADQTGGGYMDYVTMSFDAINSNQVILRAINHHSSSAATGAIRYIIYKRP